MSGKISKYIKETHRQKLFDLIELAAEKFEKEHGVLKETSNFDLYGEYLVNAVVEFNSIENTHYNPEKALESWPDAIDKEMKENDDGMEFMNEAMENWRNLTD
ncbi:hypothetical protein JL49_13260 [Pseudoalteromonas luteoviolacea]|nr:hypothetical protein JL49_13260 [Pseudoalteromonas luteoviolacea]